MIRALIIGCVADMTSLSAFAIGPAEIFEKVAPSVWSVRALDAQQQPLASGSAVVIGPERLVTTCHILVKASAVEVRRESETHGARLEHADTERDLCVIAVDGLAAPPVELVPLPSVRVGQRAYAVTYTEKLGLGLDEGLVSGLQSSNAALPPLRVSMALTPDASGGGVFDDNGRLVGIATQNVARAGLPANLNFAVPADWIREVPARAKLALAKRDAERSAKTAASPAALAPGELPPPGSKWTYRMKDRVFTHRSRDFSVQLAKIDGWNVTEIVSSGEQQGIYAVNARDLTFYPRPMNGEAVFELSPYLLAYMPKPQVPLAGALRAYPSGIYADAWRMRVTQAQADTVVVPAGRFEAVRVVVNGQNPAITQPAMYGGSGMNGRDYRTQRFEFTAWYVAELGRYVQVRHRMFNRMGEEIGDELIQLMKFDLPAAATQAKGK